MSVNLQTDLTNSSLLCSPDPFDRSHAFKFLDCIKHLVKLIQIIHIKLEIANGLHVIRLCVYLRMTDVNIHARYHGT